MDINSRKSALRRIFANVKTEEQELLDRLIDEMVFLEDQMEKLRQMPFISVHPTRPDLQRATVASRQYKECSQSYMNAVRILLGVLHKVDEDAANELLKRLEDFR